MWRAILGATLETFSGLETCFTIQEMSTALLRGLAILEHLARYPQGLPITLIASELDLPLSACHRLLAELQARDYVRQARKQGDYVLTTKVVSLGLGFLSSGGIVEIAEPLLEKLARSSGELVRLSIVDEERLTFVAKAQGPRQAGLRYDPDMGADARLSCTASGHAWLMTLSDERALEIVSRQGCGTPADYGPKAPTTIKGLLAFLQAARMRGYAMIDEVFAPGMTAMAAPVLRRKEAIGVISIAGPRARLTPARIHELGPELQAAAAELGPISNASSLFGKPPLGKG
jgi:DNA-binding IclR family transcriptional regulator